MGSWADDSPKSDPHAGSRGRQLGHVYVAPMVVADLSILTVYRFNGQFNAFHVGAIVNMACLWMALRPMLAEPRPVQWRLMHYMWVSWSYVGLLAAALTEFLIRTRPFGVGAATIAATAGASALVGVVGAVLIQRFKPKPVTA